MPVIAARSQRLNVPKTAFFIAKYFGSGVIIATAFIHVRFPSPPLKGLDGTDSRSCLPLLQRL